MENKINVLVVDDEQIVLDSIKKHLRNEDCYRVFTAISVADALEIISNNKINIILTDLMMPEIDGLEFLKIIQEKSPLTINIMITGYATINTALQAQQLGAFDYLAKPFTRTELKKLVKRASELVIAEQDSEQEQELSLDHCLPKKDINQFDGRMKGIGEFSWLMKEEGETVLIGVERSFLYGIGTIQNVYLPEVGDKIRQGSVYFQVFSTDLRSESILSPLSGTVAEVNNEVIANPNETLQEPYDKGWLIRIIPSKFDEEIKILGY